MGAVVGCMVGTTVASMVVAVSVALVVVFPGAAVLPTASAVGFVGGGVTVRVDGRGLFAGVSIGFEIRGVGVGGVGREGRLGQSWHWQFH